MPADATTTETTQTTEGEQADAGRAVAAATEDVAGLKSALSTERDARKNAEKTLRTLQAEIDQLKGKDKSDVERLTGERDKLLNDLNDRSAKLRATLAEQRVRDAAAAAGARNPKLIFRIAKDDLEIDDEGTVTNLDAVLKEARKAAPELFGAAKADGGRGINDHLAPVGMNAMLRQKAGVRQR